MKTDALVPLKCKYEPEDDILLAPDHCFFKHVSAAQNIRKTEQESLLDVVIDIHDASHRQLRNAVIRVVIKGAFGIKLLQWASEVIDQVYLLDSGISDFMLISVPVPCSALKQMKEIGPCRLHSILEDGHGNILDDTAGQIMIQD